MLSSSATSTVRDPDALQLARVAAAGDDGAWHELVETYSDLIYSVIIRYLPGEREDDQRSVYVAVLEQLFRGDLREYDGRTRMTTWLACRVRSRCIDHIRHERGRRHLPSWLADAPAVYRHVFRLYYLEGQDARTICREIRSRGYATFDATRLAEVVIDMDQKLGRRARTRIAFDLQARSIGVLSGRLLQFIQRTSADLQEQEREGRPDRQFQQREVEGLLRRVRRFIGELPHPEKAILELRYYQNQTARRTAELLSLDSQRRVYTIESRAIRRLRSMLQPPPPSLRPALEEPQVMYESNQDE